MSQKPDQDTVDFLNEMNGIPPDAPAGEAAQDGAAASASEAMSNSAASDESAAPSSEREPSAPASPAGMHYDDDVSAESNSSKPDDDAGSASEGAATQEDPPPIPSVVTGAGASDESEQNVTSQGIPSVTGGGNAAGNDNKKKGLFMLLLALVLLIVGLIVYFKFFKQPAVSETEASAPVTSSLTSSRQLAAVELPVAPPEPEPRDEPVEPTPPVELQPQMLMPPPTAAAAANVDANGKPLPTLEELKFAAPMMGMLQPAGASSNSGYAPASGAAAYGATGYDAAYGANALGGSMPAGQGSGGALASQLNAVPTPQSDARVIKQQSLTLSKGTVIECILETRVDTTVPGMTSCVIPRDIYSMNGRILLIERGTKAIGEYQGAVQNGLARIFMLWTELRTPNGVSIQLNSPVADALGGAGMGGYVDYHWFKRFGNALLFSLISDGFQYIVNTANENNNNGDVTYENTQDGMDEIIKEAMAQSGNIPPTLIKNQGERVSIFVARDLNFSQVYGVKREQSHAPAMISAY